MPRKYQRKTERQNWSEESMAEAIKKVLENKISLRRASEVFNIPLTTLHRKIDKSLQKNLQPVEAAKKNLGSYRTTFTDAQEQELVQHVLLLKQRMFGVSLTDLRKLAFELAQKNNIAHRYNMQKNIAGKDWLYGFLDRNKELLLRQPETTSLACARGFNQVSVDNFFSLLGSIYEEHKFSPDDIYNVDEIGIMIVPNRTSKVLALRGKKQVGSLSSSERGVLVTVEMCMSAAGRFVPSMFVFPRKKQNPRLMDDAPPGSFAAYHECGSIQKENFTIWFKKFIEFSNPSPEKPVLLLLDGHASHTKSIELFRLAQQHNVILLCFPPNCTHRLQPLDVSLMPPISVYYEQEVRKWLIQHPGRCVTIYEVAKLFGAAYLRAADIQTAIEGFKKTGIFPFNRHVFPDYMFAISQTTDRPVEHSEPSTSRDYDALFTCEEDEPSTSSDYGAPFAYEEGEPSTSRDYDAQASSFSCTPTMLMPIPQEENRVEKIPSRRRDKTVILTSSTSMKELELERNMKEDKKMIKPKRVKKDSHYQKKGKHL